jgi:PAS domain S-box-containing protein
MLSPHLVASALESAPDAIVISDGSGRIVLANQQVRALFGYESEELVGGPIEQLLPDRLRTAHVSHRLHFALAPRARPMGAGIDLYARRKDGTEFPVEISLSPIHDPGGMLVVAAVRDVTDRKRIQSDLIAARQAADRARQLADEARDVADRANQAKGRFLATASHDLRQPLQSLALLNGALRRRVADPDTCEALAQQEQAIGAMSRLLRALLDIGKLESGAVRPEISDFAVASLFEDLRREFASLALSKGLELQVESCEDAIRSDPSLLEQVLRNLVSNAIKYTHRGRVLIRCLHEAAVVRLEVLDTGIGIPPDQLPHIFEEFFQIGVTANTTRDGYGLGLSIVSRIVKLLGLRLEVQSEPGNGSSFCVAIPAGAARDRVPERIPCPSSPGESSAPRPHARVLLVEDDVGVRTATCMLLEAAGYEVLTAASRLEALQRLEGREHPDLIITDYHLGAGGTGVEVIACVRERCGLALPAILLSGDTSSVVRGLPHDEMCRIASKPLQAEHLLALMGELLGC